MTCSTDAPILWFSLSETHFLDDEGPHTYGDPMCHMSLVRKLPMSVLRTSGPSEFLIIVTEAKLMRIVLREPKKFAVQIAMFGFMQCDWL